jgi:hypothetical protein
MAVPCYGYCDDVFTHDKEMVDMCQTESGLDQAKRSELLRILQSRF